ncbi:uncharacterized protein LOC101776524 [Setaria italica]|nr:uncharacterized protein LOC101776524 [Setaria italica]
MCKMHECGRVHVRSPSLRFLCSDGFFDELFIDDAPKLEWVLGYDMYFYSFRTARLTIVHAPKLGFLGYLGVGSPAIQIGATIFTEDQIIVKTLMPNLKTLAVKLKNMSRAGEVKRFMQLLELFPNLETLYIQGYRCLVQPEDWSVNQDAAASWDDLRLAPCVHNHLERVVFQDYSGHGWQRQMAKFLHGNSRFLKTLEFHCMDHVETRPFGIRPPSPDLVRKQREVLCLDSRASRDACFLFFKHMLATHHHVSCHQESYKRKYYDNLYEI